MYSIKPIIHNNNVDIDLPTSMYRMKNIYNSCSYSYDTHDGAAFSMTDVSPKPTMKFNSIGPEPFDKIFHQIDSVLKV